MAAELIEPTIGVHEGDILDGKYRIESRLGGGGMGVVWAAHHIHLNKRVAIKFPREELQNNRDFVRRFMREAWAAANIKSDHVVRVLDVTELDNGIRFQVMEYLDGGDLKGWLKQKGALPISQAVDFILQTCECIAEAHTMGIIHRDLKPSNLFCTRGPGGQPWIKVLDFGISKVLPRSAVREPNDGTAATRSEALLGTRQYMSPEQVISPGDIDARTDIWSLGVILFELLTGRLPLAEPSLRQFRPEASTELEAVVNKCLEKERKLRFETVAQFAQALLPFTANPGTYCFADASVPSSAQDDSFNTLVPSLEPQEEALEKPSTSAAIRNLSDSVGPFWRRRVLWSAPALGVLAIVGLYLRHLHHPTRNSPMPSTTASFTPAPIHSARRDAVSDLAAHKAKPSSSEGTQAAKTGTPLTRPQEPEKKAHWTVPPPRESSTRSTPPRRTRGGADCEPDHWVDSSGYTHWIPECL